MTNFKAINQTCLALNAKLHVCAQKLLRQDAIYPQNIEDVGIDQYISEFPFNTIPY